MVEKGKLNQQRSAADELVDELLPQGLDWQGLVRGYPVPALALAALGGFLLGRSRGPALVTALAAFAADQVSRSVVDVLGQEAP